MVLKTKAYESAGSRKIQGVGDQCVVECQKRILLRIAVKEVCVGHIVQDPAPSLNIELAFLAELAPIEVSVE